MEQSAAFNAGHTLGMIVFPVLILAVGIYFGNRLGKKRADGTFVRWPVGVALAVDLLALLGQCSAPGKAQATGGTADVVVEQRVAGSSTGFPNKFDAAFIKRFNDGVHDAIVDSLRKNGATISPGAVSATTTVANFGGHNVLKSQISVPSRLFMYQFAGASKGQMILVVCTSRTAHPFESGNTECENRAAKAYNS